MVQSKQHKIKIIGGNWKNSNIKVINQQGLRPTSARLRKTLFNWLLPHLLNENCLDLFAGTGILGLEALSRGASKTTFVEKSKIVCNNLRSNLAKLATKNQYELYNSDSTQLIVDTNFIEKFQRQKFGIIFIDPPFDNSFCIKLLMENILNYNLTKSNAIFYTELPANAGIQDTVNSGNLLEIYKHTKISQVQGTLWHKK